MTHGEPTQDLLQITRIGRYQILWLIIGILVLLADGFDAQMVGYVAPSLAAAWHIAPADLASVFAANVSGLMIGALAIATLADMWGRRWIITACVAVFGVTSLLTAMVVSIEQLAVIRFISGVALGGAMPCMIAATSDYFPIKYRTRLAVVMTASWSLGMAVCGLATGYLIESRGWQSLFIAGGVLPIVLIPLLAMLPESPVYMIRHGQLDKLRAVLKRIDPTLVYQPKPLPVKHKFPVTSLFQGPLLKVTPLIWLAYFVSGVPLYFFLNWLPSFIKDMGYQPGQAAYVSTLYQLGGLIGGLLIGYAVDKFGALALAISLVLASMAAVFVGLSVHSIAALAIAVTLAGWFVLGTQITSNAYTGSVLYPSEARATGLGWALGWVRLSGVLAGSYGVGFLLRANLGPVKSMLFIAVPEIIAAIAFFAVHFIMRRTAVEARLSPLAVAQANKS